MLDTPASKSQVFVLGTQAFLGPFWLVIMVPFGTHIFFIVEFADLLKRQVYDLCPTLLHLKQVILVDLLLKEFT